MFRFIRRIFLGLFLLTVVGLLVLYIPAHWQIRQIEPVLPTHSELFSALAEVDAARESTTAGPVSIRYVNTASQQSSLAKISHVGVFLTWADGRHFLIDSGMDADAATQFGNMLKLISDAEDSITFGSIPEQAANEVSKIRGIAFSHLHEDHTQGLSDICAAAGSNKPTVFQTPDQATKTNYLTLEGQAFVANSGCPQQTLGEETIKSVSGFPGLLAIAAGGHTPGSTIYAANVAGKTWLMAGDISNSMEKLVANQDKPKAYSLLITPEHTKRLALLRGWLNEATAKGANVVIAHDLEAMQAAGIKPLLEN